MIKIKDMSGYYENEQKKSSYYRYGNTDILFAVTEFIDDFSGIPEAINIEKK